MLFFKPPRDDIFVWFKVEIKIAFYNMDTQMTL